MAKIRVSRAVVSHMEGSQAWAEVARARRNPRYTPNVDYCGADTLSVIAKIMDAPTRRDGSCLVEMTEGEAARMFEYADVLAVGARDNVAWERSALGELNSARGFMRQVRKAFPNLEVWSGVGL